MYIAESLVKPEYMRGHYNDFIVLTMNGLLQVLRDREFEAKLAAYPDQKFTIFFRAWRANIGPNDELWKMIARIAEDYLVEVSPNGVYCPVRQSPWTGSVGRFGRFEFMHLTIKNQVRLRLAA